jgi:Trk K+ transport system NAD-binding subunit
VAQISEFSLIVAALGLSIGHISSETVGLITLVGVVTIFISTYLILYSGQLYAFLSTPLKIFERHDPYRETAQNTPQATVSVDVILVGLGNYGSGLAEYLLRRDKTILGVDFDPAVLEFWRLRGVSVLYGDMADPEIHEQLPLNKARWVISTVRSTEMSLALLHNLKKEQFQGKVALTATNEEEARVFADAGAHLVFRPFNDATEQAADALTYAMDFLPDTIDWPVSFLEVRIKSDAAAVGKTIEHIPLRSLTGVSILAVSRGGQMHYDPPYNFRIFPGDRLLIMGPPGGLKDAERVLNQLEIQTNADDKDRFAIAEISLAENSSLSGHSLADLGFRQKYGVTMIGIRRGEKQISTIDPSERIQAGDTLIIIGKSGTVDSLKEQQPL